MTEQNLMNASNLIGKELVEIGQDHADRVRSPRKHNVRNASLDDLIGRYHRAFGEDLVLPEGVGGELLPRNVMGIDVARRLELREVILMVPCMGVAPSMGTCLVPSVDEESADDVAIRFTRENRTGQPVVRLAYGRQGLLDAVVSGSDSPLAGHEECVVASVASSQELHYVQIRFRFLHELEASTLLYMLVRSGAITREQLQEGSDAVREAPYPLPQEDSSAVSAPLEQESEEEPADAHARAIASLAIGSEFVPVDAEATINEACVGRVDARELREAIARAARAFAAAKETTDESFVPRDGATTDGSPIDQALFERVQRPAYVEQQALTCFRRILDACSLQQRFGLSVEDFNGLRAATGDFITLVLAGSSQVAAKDVEKVKRAQIFDDIGIQEVRMRKERLFGARMPMPSPEELSSGQGSHAGGHSWPPAQQTTRDIHVTVEYMTPEKIAHLQRVESALTGESLEVYSIVGFMGGAVDMTEIGEQLITYQPPSSLYQLCIFPLIQDGLLVERDEEAPLGDSETKAKRFYTWRQLDHVGEPSWDWQAYQQWLYGRLELFSHAGELTNLMAIRANMEADLARCGIFEKGKKEALKRQIADIGGRIDLLSADAARNAPKIEELRQKLNTLTAWLQSGIAS